MTRALALMKVATPAYVIDRPALERNVSVLDDVAARAPVRVLLAQKAFSAYDTYDLIGRHVAGTAASGLYEARLGRTMMPGGEVHVYAPAYVPETFDEVASLADAVVFNSFEQWIRFRPIVEAERRRRPLHAGLRINPLYSEIQVDLYNPARPDSRLGLTPQRFSEGVTRYGLDGLDGLHVHVLCEDSAATLGRVLDHVYAAFLPAMKAWPSFSWFNLGGGHHITRPGYDVDLLVSLLSDAHAKTNATLYIEPGEAVALNAGWLVSRVLDFATSAKTTAILDVSAVCHMPDVLEMPYRPRLFALHSDGSESPGHKPGEAPHTVLLGGPSCLAGDVVGAYAFDRPLAVGDRIVFEDMAIYTMVKTNTFNGIPLPAIALYDGNDVHTLRTFGYDDFVMRLGSVDGRTHHGV